MSRYSTPQKIRAPHWDEDEAAWVKTKLSYPATQRIEMHGKRIKFGDMADENEIAACADHMARALIEMLDRWTLRTPEVPYEAGLDRPTWDLSLEAIQEQPLEDILFLFTEAMKVFKVATAGDTDDALITPTAEAEGLTPINFRPGDADGGDLPGGPHRLGRRSG